MKPILLPVIPNSPCSENQQSLESEFQLKMFGRYLNSDDRIEADIVVLRHTLEHIKNPFDFLKMLRDIFGDEAFVFIEVPQFNWIEKKQGALRFYI